MDAYSFWKRVDACNPFSTVKKLSEVCGIDYNRVKKNRSDMRLPNLEDAYALARILKVSLEFLITGEDSRPHTVGDRLYQALLEQAPAVLQGLIETYIEKKDTSSVPRMA